jgi:beta-glucosidase
LIEAAGDQRMRLLGFEGVELRPGESRSTKVTVDARLLAHYDGDAHQWHIAEGNYRVGLGNAANDLVLMADTPLTGRLFGR